MLAYKQLHHVTLATFTRCNQSSIGEPIKKETHYNIWGSANQEIQPFFRDFLPVIALFVVFLRPKQLKPVAHPASQECPWFRFHLVSTKAFQPGNGLGI